mgnify:CR=1 FL=1
MFKFLFTSAIVPILILSCEVDPELNIKLCKGEYISSLNTSYYDSVTIYLPNAFTPGQDGINDYYAPKGKNLDYLNSYSFEIKKASEVVFSSSIPDSPWWGTKEGTSDGTPLESGNYHYTLSYTDSNNIVVTHSGIISLIVNENENANISIDSCSECIFGDMIDARFGLIHETNETNLPCN